LGLIKLVFSYFISKIILFYKIEGLKIYGKGLAIIKVERKSDFSDKAYLKPETH